MTVLELIEELQQMHSDDEVLFDDKFVAKDIYQDGNGYINIKLGEVW